MVESRLRFGWRDALDIARGRAVRLDGAHLRRSFVPLCRFSGSLVLAGDASRENDVLSGQARAMAASCRLYDIVAPASFIASVSMPEFEHQWRGGPAKAPEETPEKEEQP